MHVMKETKNLLSYTQENQDHADQISSFSPSGAEHKGESVLPRRDLLSQGSLPKAFSDEALKILYGLRPEIIDTRSWKHLVQNTQYFTQEEDKMRDLFSKGWSVESFFGFHPKAPLARFDCMGCALTNVGIRIKHSNATLLTMTSYVKADYTFPKKLMNEGETSLIVSLIDEEVSSDHFRSPTQEMTEHILSFLEAREHGQDHPRKRTIEYIAHSLRLDDYETFKVMNTLWEQGIVEHEYSGVYRPVKL